MRSKFNVDPTGAVRGDMLASAAMRLVFLILATALFVLGGCSAKPGDACEINTDCGQSMVCERSLPEGYCTRENCAVVECPAGGLCVQFDADTSYCMQPCEQDEDCRDGYICVAQFGPHPFCNDTLGVVPDDESDDPAE